MKFYSLHLDIWQEETAYLPLEEQAIYLRLVNHYHRKEKPIPKDYEKTAKILGLSDHMETVGKIINLFFTLDGDVYRHAQYDENIAQYHAKIARNTANGSKGGRPKRVSHAAPNGEY